MDVSKANSVIAWPLLLTKCTQNSVERMERWSRAPGLDFPGWSHSKSSFRHTVRHTCSSSPNLQTPVCFQISTTGIKFLPSKTMRRWKNKKCNEFHQSYSTGYFILWRCKTRAFLGNREEANFFHCSQRCSRCKKELRESTILFRLSKLTAFQKC